MDREFHLFSKQTKIWDKAGFHNPEEIFFNHRALSTHGDWAMLCYSMLYSIVMLLWQWPFYADNVMTELMGKCFVNHFLVCCCHGAPATKSNWQFFLSKYYYQNIPGTLLCYSPSYFTLSTLFYRFINEMQSDPSNRVSF